MSTAIPPTESVTNAGQSDPPPSHDWSIAQSRAIYGIDDWGRGYFRINDAGHVTVSPTPESEHAVDLYQLVRDLEERGITTPLLLRFSDILKHRITRIAHAFRTAMTDHDYQGDFCCVYPIKVNQQRHVVEEVIKFGRPHDFGVEAGSKPELLALLALVDDDKTPIICNGFKDSQFIETVLLAAKMGRHVIPVVEKFSELQLIVEHATKYGICPQIGVRIKLSSPGAGRWQASGGHRSKFGLFTSELLQAVEYLTQHDMLSSLALTHFHLGSQINDIQNVKAAVNEATRIYAELCQMGVELKYLDVGGGLGIDYDGTMTSRSASINYALQEYANNVVYHVREVCEDCGVPHPTIISESGRAMVAHHSVLLVNILGRSGFDQFEKPPTLTDAQLHELPLPIRTLYETYDALNQGNYIEYFHDAQLARDETQSLFNLGYCSLVDRALAERLFYRICMHVSEMIDPDEQLPDEFKRLEAMLSDTYFGNWSVFQSLPDSWAIDQLFPIMPIHRLGEQPTRSAILADITCDSDGKVDQFICGRTCRHALPMHPLEPDRPYVVGAFLCGAYQEILGDLHNLLGDTNAVHVRIDEQGNPVIDEVVEGDTVAEVLGYVQFDAADVRRNFRRVVEQAVRHGRITISESRQLRWFYEQGLGSYTYLT